MVKFIKKFWHWGCFINLRKITINTIITCVYLLVEVSEASVGSTWYRRRLCPCWFYSTVDGATWFWVHAGTDAVQARTGKGLSTGTYKFQLNLITFCKQFPYSFCDGICCLCGTYLMKENVLKFSCCINLRIVRFFTQFDPDCDSNWLACGCTEITVFTLHESLIFIDFHCKLLGVGVDIGVWVGLSK